MVRVLRRSEGHAPSSQTLQMPPDLLIHVVGTPVDRHGRSRTGPDARKHSTTEAGRFTDVHATACQFEVTVRANAGDEKWAVGSPGVEVVPSAHILIDIGKK